MSTLRLLGDVVSPMVRAVMLFMEANAVPYELVYISLAKSRLAEGTDVVCVCFGN